jgi:transposase-like protein
MSVVQSRHQIPFSDNSKMKCKIVPVGRRRDGGTRYWCLTHHANATAKYGVAALKCVAANDVPISPEETLDLDFEKYPGGIALWGSVPAVYDTTTQSTDRGIHVHARRTKNGLKDIDRTYRKLRIPLSGDLLSDGWVEVDEIDAINYMISGVFGFQTISVNCIYCGFPHLDRDWFSVHTHRRHQCHGCGRQFSDSVSGIGNPLANIRQLLGAKPTAKIKAPESMSLRQRDYPGGIQIWGSNPAIVWTSDEPEETGIHIHAFSSHEQKMPSVDDTYSKVTIDGVKLDANQVRTYMAQSSMPHLEGRIVDLVCPSCGESHFDQAEMAYTPHIDHECHSCETLFRSQTQIKKTIGNPFVAVRRELATKALNPMREDKLGLRPETI